MCGKNVLSVNPETRSPEPFRMTELEWPFDIATTRSIRFKYFVQNLISRGAGNEGHGNDIRLYRDSAGRSSLSIFKPFWTENTTNREWIFVDDVTTHDQNGVW